MRQSSNIAPRRRRKPFSVKLTVGHTIWQIYLHSCFSGNRALFRIEQIITDLEITKEYFNPKEGFSFKDWAAESFGVFHGDALLDIKIRFSKEVADRAEKVQFHASQKMVKQKDGSLIMFLKCRGHRELIWELLHSDWLGNVKIESPERLQEEYLEQLERAKSAV